MSTTTRKTARNNEFYESPFVLAIAVMRERVRSLPREDQNDLYELLPALLGGDDEERASASKAVKEIFDQASGKLQRMELPSEPGPTLQNWIGFVSKRLRDARAKKGLTQEELAERSGIPQSHISRLESGQHSPTTKTLEKLANALGKSMSYFDTTASDEN